MLLCWVLGYVCRQTQYSNVSRPEMNLGEGLMSKRKTQNHVFGGRPPLPVDAVRGERVVTFLTRSEHDQLVNIARAEGKSVSLTCHDLLMKGIEANATKVE